MLAKRVQILCTGGYSRRHPTCRAKVYGFVQTYDEKPRRRLWELMKSQGMQENQQVVLKTPGGRATPTQADSRDPRSSRGGHLLRSRPACCHCGL
jgi:hypothetical protein